MNELVGQILDHYQIISLLGEGGMGAVYKATDVTLQRSVALKVMHPHFATQTDFVERFLQEARSAARLDHPGIVKVFDFGQSQNLFYIVMEFIPGANLQKMMNDLRADSKWILMGEAVQLIRQVTVALDYAHRNGVLHRDIKPGNLMLKPEASDGLPYRPVITDLGLAKLLEGGVMTQEGTSLGTPAYMSPEQAMGLKTDARSDVYSLGILLYELTVGRLPFPVKSLTEAIRYHTKEPPPPPVTINPNFPELLQNVILKSIEKDPAKRFPDAAQFAKALEVISSRLQNVTGETVMEGGVEAPGISLLTKYEESLVAPRGPSILKEFPSPPPSTGRDLIQILSPEKTAKTVTVKQGGMKIGRDKSNDIVLDDAKVSRNHAAIEFDGSQYRVVDLNSTNGTYLGNAKLLPGVPQTWSPDQALRIGNFWLRLLRVRQDSLAPVMTHPDGTMVSQSMIKSSAGEGRIGLYMEDSTLSVEPGRSVTAAVIILNQGSVVDHFEISVEGIPARWLPSIPPAVQLMPGQQQTVSFVIQPERSPRSRAGRHPLTIRVTSKSPPEQTVEVKATLTLASFSQTKTSLYPQRIRTRQKASVTVENQGNIQDTYALTWQDRGNELAFKPPQAQLRIPEGQSAAAEFLAVPRRRQWLGGEKTFSFTAKVAPSKGEPQVLSGEVVGKGLIPVWIPALAVILVLAACALLFLFLKPRVDEVVLEPQTPIAGQSLTVRWKVHNAQAVDISPLVSGLDPTQGQYTFSQGLPASTTVTLVARGLLGRAEKPLAISVGVAEPGAPLVELWEVSKTQVTKGEQVVIKWRVSNAESVIIQPFGSVENEGERVDTPQQTKTYSLLAVNKGKQVQKSQEVVVAAPPVNAPEIKTFTADPAQVIKGKTASIRLSWETGGADKVSISGVGDVSPTDLGFTDVAAPAQDTVYTLIAKNAGGEVTRAVQVTVQGPLCTVTTDNLNMRGGPGMAYDPPIKKLPLNTQLEPLAYNANGIPEGTWIKVKVVGSGEEGWVSSKDPYISCNIDVTGLPSAAAPMVVSGVTVQADPASFTGACPKAFLFTASITASDAGMVSYQWFRSDGTSTTAASLNFAAAGAQNVTDSWQLNASGTYQEKIRILSPNVAEADSPSVSLTCQTKPRVAYVYSSDSGTASSFQNLLQSKYSVDLVSQGSVLSTDFSPYIVIIIGPETGNFSAWKTNPWGDSGGSQATQINNSNKPILGVGRGGALLFQAIGLQINWGNAAVCSGTDVRVVNSKDNFWKNPNAIPVADFGAVNLYTTATSNVCQYLPSPVTGVTMIGQSSDNTTYYPIVEQSGKYLLWGFDGGPATMSSTGQSLFVNAVERARPLLFRIPPIQILPTLVVPKLNP